MSFAEADLTIDAFLGGRVSLAQPRKGYRAATDAVLLAAAVGAKRGQRVLDVGCGAGAAMACLDARLPGLEMHGLEVQPAYAALARRNAPAATVWEGDVETPPPGLRDIAFDWAMTNPPFFEEAAIASPTPGRDASRRAAISLRAWTAAALRRVRSGGRIAAIHLAERLPELLAGLDGAGDVAILPLRARAGRDAKRVIVTARKGGRGPARIAPGLIIHEGPRHTDDRDDFTPAVEGILRRGEALIF